MATYTQNYTLHQWEDTDDFLRSDFNEDFAKIDTAIKTEKTALQGSIATNAYNIYNLMLQNYYDGKYTGYKKALLFDGFSTAEAEGRTLSDSLCPWNNCLNLSATGAQSEEWTETNTISTSSNLLTTREVDITAMGILTGYTFFVTNGTTSDYGQVTCYINSTAVESGYIYYADRNGTELPYVLQTPFPVGPGDTVEFKLTKSVGTITYLCWGATSLSGRIDIAATVGSQGTLTLACDVGTAWDTVHLWARYHGGTITPTAGNVAMTLVESAEALTLDEQSCYESHWVGVAGTDTLNLTLALTRTDDSLMELFDYGLLLV